MLSMFILTVGDSWNTYFYEYTRINSPAAVFLFYQRWCNFQYFAIELVSCTFYGPLF